MYRKLVKDQNVCLHVKVAAPLFKPEIRLQISLVPNAWANQMSVKITSVPDCVRACSLISSFQDIAATLNVLLNRVLARISEFGVQKYTFGMNWVSSSFSSHCIMHTHKIWILGRPKSVIGCAKDTRTPLWLNSCNWTCITSKYALTKEKTCNMGVKNEF